MTAPQTQDLPKTTPGQEITPPQEGDKGALGNADEKKFSQAEVNEQLNEHLTKAGRTDKELTDRAAALKQGEETLATATKTAQEDRDEAERQAVTGNPDALASLATVQAQRKQREENQAEKLRLEQQASSLKDRETALAGSATERLAQAIGAEAKVDAKLLLQYLPNGTEAQMKELAGRLPKVDPTTTTSPSGTSAPDSGITTGTPTEQQKLKSRYPSMT